MKLQLLACFLALHATVTLHAEPIEIPDPTLLVYNLRTTVEAYDKVGHKDPKWDDRARKCLRTFASICCSTNEPGDVTMRELQQDLKTVVEAKCDDPFIRYLYLRYVYADEHSTDANAAAYRDMSSSMEKSGYPAIRKYYTSMRTRYVLQTFYPQSRTAQTFLDRATESLVQALDDTSMPAVEGERACELLMSTAWWTQRSRYDLYEKLSPVLEKHWQKESFALLAKGQAYLTYAWAAFEAGGSANPVSEQNRKLMQERLDISEKALREAWKQNPDDLRICHEMIYVEMLRGGDRERMETWFQRGMKLNPADYGLCFEKLDYLRPRWHGSHEEMLKFARECATNPDWTGAVPMVLADTHAEISKEIVADQRAVYWKQPVVWSDVQKSFDQLFKVSPKETGFRQNYALYAYMAEQWPTFMEQVKLFPSTNYNYFGGVDHYNLMIKTAEEHLTKK